MAWPPDLMLTKFLCGSKKSSPVHREHLSCLFLRKEKQCFLCFPSTRQRSLSFEEQQLYRNAWGCSQDKLCGPGVGMCRWHETGGGSGPRTILQLSQIWRGERVYIISERGIWPEILGNLWAKEKCHFLYLKPLRWSNLIYENKKASSRMFADYCV